MQAVGDLLGRAGGIDECTPNRPGGGRISTAWHPTDGGTAPCLRLLCAEPLGIVPTIRARKDATWTRPPCSAATSTGSVDARLWNALRSVRPNLGTTRDSAIGAGGR